MTTEFFGVLDNVVTEHQTKKERITASLSQAQRNIGHGSKVLLLTPSLVQSEFVIGRVAKTEEYESLRNYGQLETFQTHPFSPTGSDEEEAEAYANGYRRGLYFSDEYQAGFINSFHISRLYPLTDGEYDAIRGADFDGTVFRNADWFKELHEAVLTAVEMREGSPYRKYCPKCAGKNVLIAKDYVGRSLHPIGLQPSAKANGLVVRTGHVVEDRALEEKGRRFYCKDCKWESEYLDDAEYPEVHACATNQSQLESIFLLNELAL